MIFKPQALPFWELEKGGPITELQKQQVELQSRPNPREVMVSRGSPKRYLMADGCRRVITNDVTH